MLEIPCCGNFASSTTLLELNVHFEDEITNLHCAPVHHLSVFLSLKSPGAKLSWGVCLTIIIICDDFIQFSSSILERFGARSIVK